MHLLHEASKTRPFLFNSIRDTFIMVQRLPEGRKETKRVETTECESALARSRRYQARVQKYRTTCPKCGFTKKQKECRKCIV